MEDIGKALIMSAQVLMFVFASTISIYLYSVLTANINDIMLASDYSNRGDAIFGSLETANKREATKEEIILAILDLKDKYKKTEDKTYQVKVNGDVYKYDPSGDRIILNDILDLPFNSASLRANLNDLPSSPSYELSYDESSKVLIYTN